jgi:hypothetical protein
MQDYLLEQCAARKVSGVIFAVTSANHSYTRRNPVPLHLRAMIIQEFSRSIPVPVYVYGIDEVGVLPDFATYVIRRIESQSDGRFQLTPDNTIVSCSTPSVMATYAAHGFEILPAELTAKGEYHTPVPWDIVESAAVGPDELLANEFFCRQAHPASVKVWGTYDLHLTVRRLFSDDIIGDDGDLTGTRDYNSYVRQMDEIAELKYRETAPHVIPGRIGDVGCAVGSWIKLATEDELLHESEFYGIEVSRPLFEICNQRKSNGEFANPYVFFSRKNAVTDSVFPLASMHTIHCSSLTHEIYSYASESAVAALQSRSGCSLREAFARVGQDQLRCFIDCRLSELRSGGVWINRDVVGPDQPEREVLVWLSDTDGDNDTTGIAELSGDALTLRLRAMSTRARFAVFAKRYRADEGYHLSYAEIARDGKAYLRMQLGDAWEFATKKDYCDNWQSEMHESFCHWSFGDWGKALAEAGFQVSSQSTTVTNPWIVTNRLEGKLELYDSLLNPIPYPATHMLIVAQKR